MLSYPLTIGVDAGSLLVTSPDFPELTTLGDDLDEAIAARMHSRLDMPAPSHGGYGGAYATLRSLPVVKVMLYQGGGMRDQEIDKAELVRRLGWQLPQADRVLNVQHRSQLDQFDAALAAIGLQLDVTAREIPPVLAGGGSGGPTGRSSQRDSGETRTGESGVRH